VSKVPERIAVSRKDATVASILRATYPDYRGRKIFIVPQTCPLDVKSYWEGGSRSFFRFLNLETFSIAVMPAQSGFDRQIAGADRVTLPVGIACVEHCIFCGKDCGIRIYVNPDNLVGMLMECSDGREGI
jgi:hypothetical protein